jgi:hypothetical protein
VEGKLRVFEVARQPAGGGDEGFLHDVAGVDATSEAAVELGLDHTAKRLAVALQKPVDGLRLADSGLCEELAGFVLVGPHG